jgi:hypothetical protein
MPPVPPDQLSPYGAAISDAGSDDDRSLIARQVRTRYADAKSEEDDRYLNSKQVRARYADSSDMWASLYFVRLFSIAGHLLRTRRFRPFHSPRAPRSGTTFPDSPLTSPSTWRAQASSAVRFSAAKSCLA